MRIILFLLMFFNLSLLSQTVSWDAGGDGVNWSDPDNWNTNMLPGVGDSVIIHGDSVVLNTVDPVIKNLLLINGAKLVNFATLTSTGSLNYAIRCDSASIVNHAKIVVLDVGNNEFGDRAIELLNGSHFHNTATALLDILQTNGFGIWLEDGSIGENDGSISVVTLYQIGVISQLSSNFINRSLITIEGQGPFVGGITAGAVGQFTNLGDLQIKISGLDNHGLSLTNGGKIVNEGDIIIDAQNASLGILIDGFTSLLHQKDGLIKINLSSGQGIRIFSGELKIDPGAAIEVNNPAADFYIQIDSTAIFNCDGILELGN
ncbi:MAG: hypothetical protein IPL46_18870 [Saprospiraceae bacterium]|nr:hypothetical protein [Saprospiraceae bacterium]